jgi:hypothetical protein
MMSLSKDTLKVLENFSTINPSIEIMQGNTIKTISELKNIFSKAMVEDTFPVTFAMYDLKQFLGLVSLFEEPEFDFQEKRVVVREKGSETTSSYTYSSSETFTTPGNKELTLNSVNVSFKLEATVLQNVVKAAHQLSLPEVVVRGRDGKIMLVATDTKNPSTNEFSFQVGTCPEDMNYEHIFKAINIKFMPKDYDVQISDQGIGHFKSESGLEYWVAVSSK